MPRVLGGVQRVKGHVGHAAEQVLRRNVFPAATVFPCLLALMLFSRGLGVLLRV